MLIALSAVDGTHIKFVEVACRPMTGDIIKVNPKTYHVDKVVLVSEHTTQPALIVAVVHPVEAQQ